MILRSMRRVALVAAAVVTAGCSSIDTINGVRMNATTAPEGSYCDKNPAICVLGAAAIAGGAIGLIASQRHHRSNDTPPPAAPPTNPR
jgi:hypothetical protein